MLRIHMFERHCSRASGIISVLLIISMFIGGMPAGASGNGEGGSSGARTTDTPSDLIVPSGETYELYGCHT